MKIRILCICVLFCICSSCTATELVSSPKSQETAALMAATATTAAVDQAAFAAQKDWAAGPHAVAYDLGKGPNTYCARCHSPQNWDANAKIDPPPNCVSCKFASEESPRIAVGNPLVNEEDWKGIGCEVCHRIKNGITDPAIYWYDNETGYYETAASSSELCEKCHTDTQTLKHKMDLDGGAHSDYTCTKCHNAHSTYASCSSKDCHPDVTFTEESNPEHPGHIVSHQKINCVTCHDGSGLEVGPSEEEGIWTAYRTTELLGRTQTTPYISHNLTKEVSCERCHFADNPWNIEPSVTE